MSRAIAYNPKHFAEIKGEQPMIPEYSEFEEQLNQVIKNTKNQLSRKRKQQGIFRNAKKARLCIPETNPSTKLTSKNPSTELNSKNLITGLKNAKRPSKSKKTQIYMFYPAISSIQRRRKQKERLVKAILKYEVKDEPKKQKIDPNKEEDRNIQLLLLAIDSICRCRGLVDEILRPRPGLDVVPLRNFKYVLFEKAIGLVEEFNSIMRVLVKKILKVDVADSFTDNENSLNYNLVTSMLEFV